MGSWTYGNPEDIADAMIARAAQMETAEAAKAERPARQRKDRYYSQSRPIHISSMVRLAKLGRLKNVS